MSDGSDEELEKVQKPKNFLPAIIIIILGTVVIGGVTALHEHGFFVPWRNLGNPVQNDVIEKPNKILASTPRSIRVGTTKDRAFEYSFTLTGLEGTPEEISLKWAEVPYATGNRDGKVNFGCHTSFWIPPLWRAINGVSDHSITGGCRRYVGMEQTNYLVLMDGTVWVWIHQRNAQGDIIRIQWLPWVIGAGIGIILGLLYFFWFDPQ